jgi:hypothetical protein
MTAQDLVMTAQDLVEMTGSEGISGTTFEYLPGGVASV